MVSVDGNAISTIRNSIFILEFKWVNLAYYLLASLLFIQHYKAGFPKCWDKMTLVTML